MACSTDLGVNLNLLTPVLGQVALQLSEGLLGTVMCFLSSYSQELHFYKVENDVAQVILNATNTSCRVAVHQKTLCEVDKEIKNVNEIITCQENEIAKSRLLTDRKGEILCLYNKKLEMLLSQLGVGTFVFQSQF